MKWVLEELLYPLTQLRYLRRVFLVCTLLTGEEPNLRNYRSVENILPPLKI